MQECFSYFCMFVKMNSKKVRGKSSWIFLYIFEEIFILTWLTVKNAFDIILEINIKRETLMEVYCE